MPPKERSRVLILSASMGGGHMQVAGELARRLAARGHDPIVSDLLGLMPHLAGRWLRWVYPTMVLKTPWLYDLAYREIFLAEQEHGERASVVIRLSLRRLQNLVEETEPAAVVSTYHLAALAAAQLRSTGVLKAPAVTFVTTFGLHDLWLHPATDLYLCITRAVAACLARRTRAEVALCEPVVRAHFRNSGPVAPPACLGDVPDGKLVALVVAGSLGLGGISETAAAISRIPGWRPVVLCGRNERLRREIERLPGALALGWVDDMASLFNSAACVIDNAAGSTAKEALAAGRPVVTFRPLPGHGRHDAQMMQEAGVSRLAETSDDLAEALAEAADPFRVVQRVARGRALFQTDPTDILERLLAASAQVSAA